MNSSSYAAGDSSVPESLRVEVLSIAIVGPDSLLRREVEIALKGCQEIDAHEFSAYPHSLEELPELLARHHDILLIELDSDPERALDLVERVCADRLATVMLYSKFADPDPSDPELLVRCMRAGAREFLSLPFSQASVAEALVRAAARRVVPEESKKAGGRLLAFCGVKGGCGATVLACNFATTLAEVSSDRTLLIDLDLPLGDAGLILGIAPQYSTVEALHDPQRLDSSFLSKLVVKHCSGLYVLPAPGRMVPGKATDEALEKLISLAREEFQNVVVDMGSRRNIRNSPVFAQSTTIYLVMQPGLSDLRNAHRLIAEHFGSDEPRVQVVLNRYQNRGMAVTDENIRRALTKTPSWKIPNDFQTVRRMQNTTRTTVLAESAVGAVIGKMARTVYGLPEPPAKKKGFSLRNLRKGILTDGGDSSEIMSLELGSGRNGSAPTLDAELSTHHESTEVRGSQRLDDLAEMETRLETAIADSETAGDVLDSRDFEAAPTGEAPTITWLPVEPITYGTPLSDMQYGATAEVPGKFTYTPAKGYILPAGSHSLWVTFTPERSSGRRVVQQAASITVLKATPTVDWPVAEEIPFGTPLTAKQLCATASVPGTFLYSHSEGDLLVEGTHTLCVLFSPNDAANYEEVNAQTTLVVTKPIPTISWIAPMSITHGTPLSAVQLNATASVPGTFEYLPTEGTILPAGRHTLSVIFHPANPGAFGAAQASTSLNVQPAAPEIQWSTPAPISYGTPLSIMQLNATCSIEGRFEYQPAEGTILNSGRHTLRVTFTPNDIENYAAGEFAVSLTVAKALPLITWPAPAPLMYGCPLSARQLNATASVPGSFTYIPAIGSVVSAGLHMPTVLFSPADKENYCTTQSAVPLTVLKGTPTIQWTVPATISYGTPLDANQLCAKGSVPGTLTYTPGPGDVLSVGTHLLNVVLTPSDSTNYTLAYATVPVIVTQAKPPEILWPAPQAISYGSPLSSAQLNARVAMDGDFVYTPAEGTFLTVGEHQLSVTFTPHDRNVPRALAATTIFVERAMPSLVWDTPQPLTYGEAISEEQLNASSSVRGTFKYSPGPGEQLDAGQQILTASFEPEDRENIAPGSVHVALEVRKAVPRIDWATPSPVRYGTELSSAQLNARSSVAGAFVYVPAAGTVLPPGTLPLTAIFTPSDAKNYAEARAEVQLEIQDLQYGTDAGEPLFGQDVSTEPTGSFGSSGIFLPQAIVNDLSSDADSIADPTVRSNGATAFLPSIRTEVAKPELKQEAEHDASKADEGAPALETRFYKGATYRKGADGQWHLVTR